MLRPAASLEASCGQRPASTSLGSIASRNKTDLCAHEQIEKIKKTFSYNRYLRARLFWALIRTEENNLGPMRVEHWRARPLTALERTEKGLLERKWLSSTHVKIRLSISLSAANFLGLEDTLRRLESGDIFSAPVVMAKNTILQISTTYWNKMFVRAATTNKTTTNGKWESKWSNAYD